MAFENNPWSEEFWNLTEQGAYIKQFGLEVAKTKARQAGTRLGAPRVRVVHRPLTVLVQRRDITTIINSGGGGSSADALAAGLATKV